MRALSLLLLSLSLLGAPLARAASDTEDTEVTDDTGVDGYPASYYADDKGGCDCAMATGAAGVWLLAPLAFGLTRRRRG